MFQIKVSTNLFQFVFREILRRPAIILCYDQLLATEFVFDLLMATNDNNYVRLLADDSIIEERTLTSLIDSQKFSDLDKEMAGILLEAGVLKLVDTDVELRNKGYLPIIARTIQDSKFGGMNVNQLVDDRSFKEFLSFLVLSCCSTAFSAHTIDLIPPYIQKDWSTIWKVTQLEASIPQFHQPLDTTQQLDALLELRTSNEQFRREMSEIDNIITEKGPH